MSIRTEDHRGVRADPAGLAWVVILGSALVIVIGLIGYLVVLGLPEIAAEEAAAVAPLVQPARPDSVFAPVPGGEGPVR